MRAAGPPRHPLREKANTVTTKPLTINVPETLSLRVADLYTLVRNTPSRTPVAVEHAGRWCEIADVFLSLDDFAAYSGEKPDDHATIVDEYGSDVPDETNMGPAVIALDERHSYIGVVRIVDHDKSTDDTIADKFVIVPRVELLRVQRVVPTVVQVLEPPAPQAPISEYCKHCHADIRQAPNGGWYDGESKTVCPDNRAAFRDDHEPASGASAPPAPATVFTLIVADPDGDRVSSLCKDMDEVLRTLRLNYLQHPQDFVSDDDLVRHLVNTQGLEIHIDEHNLPS